MDNRTSLSVFAALAAALTIGVQARAAEPLAEHQVPSKTAAPAAPTPTPDPYRCHPSQDISCTVVRETADGTLIITLRRRGPGARTPAWTVINGAPPSPPQVAGGTVYVVPNSTPEASSVNRQASLSPNGAPILD